VCPDQYALALSGKSDESLAALDDQDAETFLELFDPRR